MPKIKHLASPLYHPSDYRREHAVNPRPGTESFRGDFRRDYARLIHSPAFRRLQGKTQLFPGRESDYFRNRLTHSLEVAQIAKTIAIKLNFSCDELKHAALDQQISTDLVELAALAHDIGHPPFGHNGEAALHDCMQDFGGFEGNAQSLRILSRIEKRLDKGLDRNLCDVKSGQDVRIGLNLTYRSLASILKYNRKIEIEGKSSFNKGYYASEAKLVAKIWDAIIPAEIVEKPPADDLKTIECQIMDVADDIAYSTYDLDDALKAEFLSPLHLLWKVAKDDAARVQILTRVNSSLAKDKISSISDERMMAELQAVFGKIFFSASDGLLDLALQQVDKLKDDLEELGKRESATTVVETALRTIFKGNARLPLDIPIIGAYDSSQRTAVDGYLRSEFTGELVNSFVQGVEIKYNPDAPALSKVFLNEATRIRVEVLKHTAYVLIIMSSRQRVVEYRGHQIIKEIFEMLTKESLDEKGHRGHRLLPPDYRTMWKAIQSPAGKSRVICDFIACMTDRYAVEFHSRLADGGESLFKPF